MSNQSSSGHLKFEFNLGPARPMPKPEPESPFRILVLGDFSGAATVGAQPLPDRRPIRIDIDNFDQVLGKLHPAVLWSGQTDDPNPKRISFITRDDFHPDRLWQRDDMFGKFRRLRQQLLDPAAFAEAAAEVRSWAAAQSIDQTTVPTQPATAPGTSTTKAEESGLLERLLGRAPSQPPSSAPAGGLVDISALIKQAVGPYVTSAADPGRDQLIAAVDAAAGVQMRSLLRAPAFQALEAAWRGMDFLVRQLETDEQLSIHLVDISPAQLAADLTASDNLAKTLIYRVLADQTSGVPGAEPWSLIVGLYTFESSQASAALLARLAQVAQKAGAPLITAADLPSWEAAVSGRQFPASDQEAWTSLRRLPAAAYLGLALPRFLLRLPYGAQTDPVECFSFEEMAGRPEPSAYLWGNPALACACLLGQSFRQSGWVLEPGELCELGGLPVHVFKHDGESQMTPCAEIWLNETAAEDYVEQGLMPFLSIRGRDAIRLARFQSVSEPAAPLQGRWRME